MAAASAAGKPLGVAGTVFFGSLCAGTFGLGAWQTARYFEKQELTHERETSLQLPPVPWTANADASNAFRRIRMTGKFHHEREFLVGPRGPPPGALPDKPGSSAAGMASSPQGYFVLTPMTTTADDDTQQQQQRRVLINRGWVPRQMVQSPGPRASSSSSSQIQPPNLLNWNRPTGQVQVTVVPAKPEEPRFLVAQHDLKQLPAKLYWFDMPAMLAVAGIPLQDDSGQQKNVFFTQVDDGNDETADWPVKPAAGKIGEFYVTPAVHVGYAFTWYSLSAAGLYLTRKLVTRGR